LNIRQKREEKKKAKEDNEKKFYNFQLYKRELLSNQPFLKHTIRLLNMQEVALWQPGIHGTDVEK
jgi:hypothetical protein